MKAFTCFFLLLFYYSSLLFGQSSALHYFSLADSLRLQMQFEQAEYHYRIADSLYHLNNNPKGIMRVGIARSRMDLVNRDYAGAKARTEKLLEWARQTKTEGLEVASCFNILGAIAGEKESDYQESLRQHRNAMEELRKDTSSGVASVRARTLGTIGTCYEYIGDFEQALEKYREATRLLKEIYGNEHMAVAIGYSSMASIWYRKGYYKKALEEYQRAQRIQEKKLPKVHPIKLTILRGLGDSYYALGDYEKALDHYSQSERMSRTLFGPEAADVGLSLHKAGKVYQIMGETEKAISSYLKARKILINVFGKDKSQLEAVYSDLASAYLQIGQPNKALENEKRSLQLNLDIYKAGHPLVALNYRRLGHIFRKQQQFDKALDYYSQSLAILHTAFAGTHPETASSWLAVAELQKEGGITDEALSAYHHALEQFVPAFETPDLLAVPLISQIEFRGGILEAIQGKMLVLFQLYQSKNEQRYLQAASHYAKLGADYIDHFIRDFRDPGSKTFWLDKAFPFYENALRVRYQQYQNTGSEEVFWTALNLAERSKSSLLLQHLRNVDALIQGQVPDSLIEKEHRLKKDLNFYTYLLEQTEEKQDSAKEELWKQKIYILKKQYHQLIDQLEAEQPAYYHLKYAADLSNLRDLPDALPTPSSALIEYFLGERQLHLFGIHQQGLRWSAVSIDSLFFKKVNNFLALCSDQNQWLDNGKASYRKLTELGHQLYGLLIEEVIAPFASELDQLILIPDGILGYFPFEVLCTRADSPSSYLLKEVNIQYIYQARSLIESRQLHQQNTIRYLGFAPDFRQVALPPLPFATAEVKASQKIWQGRALLGKEATERRFRELAPNARILHLALHTQIDDQIPQYSKLLFGAPDSQEDNRLHTFEIFNLPLQADLVVLSACYSGRGRVLRGEGIMSLARGFSYAGVPAITMSLWEVNDAAASDLMIRFFQHLKTGMKKTEALRQAKLEHLESADKIMAAPYYWAGFVQIGDASAIKIETTSWYIWWGLAIGFLVFIYWWLKQDNKHGKVC